MELQIPKKPSKSPYLGNLLIVRVFLGVFVYVGVGKPNPPIEKFEPKMNPWNIISNIPGIYNICLFFKLIIACLICAIIQKIWDELFQKK